MTYRNHVLATLSPTDLQAIEPHLVRVDLNKDDVVTRQNEPVDRVYFPENAYLANVMRFEDGRAVETSTVGCEGVSGLAAVLADAPCTWDVVTQIEGRAWQLAVPVLRSRFEASTDLRAMFLRLTHDYQSQAAQSAACNAIHEVGPRLARWLLHIQDRTDRAEIVLTQGDMATVIGVQRTTINSAASWLRAAGAIGYRRGAVTIKNRERLEAQACECYAAQRERSRALGVIDDI